MRTRCPECDHCFDICMVCHTVIPDGQHTCEKHTSTFFGSSETELDPKIFIEDVVGKDFIEHIPKFTKKFYELHSFMDMGVVPLGLNTCPGPPECNRKTHLEYWINSPINWARNCAKEMLEKGDYIDE